jgi:hypothetical protein
VVLTAFLIQRGSAESKDPEAQHPDNADSGEDQYRADVPWPVRRGGLALKIYENSLGIALLSLFAFSFAMHAVGGAGAYSQEQMEHGGRPVTILGYLGTAHFSFESFQNWQSEFLAIGVMIVLSIYLRQRGSSQSKPVASPHSETGNESSPSNARSERQIHRTEYRSPARSRNSSSQASGSDPGIG